MFFNKPAIILGISLVCSIPAWSQTSPPVSIAQGFDRANMDLTVDPSRDFFRYTMGTYLKKHPIPASESRWGVDAELVRSVRLDLRTILEQCARVHANEEERKLGDFWTAGMDQLSQGRFKCWPQGDAAGYSLEAHQAQVLLAAGNPTVAGGPIWRSVKPAANAAKPVLTKPSKTLTSC